ncbi:hypothetical protein LCGC14_1611460, partial [marine sediment metagenome]
MKILTALLLILILAVSVKAATINIGEGLAENYLNTKYVQIIGDIMTGDLNINANLNVTRNATFDNNILFVDSTNNRVGIGQKGGFDPRIGLSVTGDIDIIHTSTEANDHAFEIIIDAAGFGDVKGIDIVYETGAIVLGEDEEVILINIDQSLAEGGDVVGVEILATEGSANIYGLECGPLVNCVIQLSGTFMDMDSANNSGADNLSNFISSSDDHPIFVNDDDYITIGDANKFEVLEFLLNTTSSNPGIKPTFEFSIGVDDWTEFFPADGGVTEDTANGVNAVAANAVVTVAANSAAITVTSAVLSAAWNSKPIVFALDNGTPAGSPTANY